MPWKPALAARAKWRGGVSQKPSVFGNSLLPLGAILWLQVYLQIPDYGKVQATIDALHGSCRLPDGSDDPTKGNQLLEVYGITIQLSTATNNSTLMKEVRSFYSPSWNGTDVDVLIVCAGFEWT